MLRRRDRRRGLRQSIELLKRHDYLQRYQKPGSLGEEKEETGRDHELCAIWRRRAKVAGWLTKAGVSTPGINLHLQYFPPTREIRRTLCAFFLTLKCTLARGVCIETAKLLHKAPNPPGLLIGQSAIRPRPFKCQDALASGFLG
ncbi:small VCP/p97-interacting protein isoform X1 [Pseudorasbora parva]|uniref:small VCP/p97-interacting protein isoform X1 n=1 Tax=Pseudorasbora parva TaxID=51549 RepID=UPI00351DFF16